MKLLSTEVGKPVDNVGWSRRVRRMGSVVLDMLYLYHILLDNQVKKSSMQ